MGLKGKLVAKFLWACATTVYLYAQQEAFAQM